MALRAGYYGLKRRFKDKLESIAGAWDATIASLFPRSEQAVTGARNFFNYDAWKSVNIVNGTAVFENNGVTLTATSNDCYTTNAAAGYPVGARIPVKKGQTIKLRWKSSVTTYKGAVYIFDSAGGYKWVQNQTEEFVYTPINDEYIVVRFGVTTNGDSISYSNIMVTLESDTYDTYSDYALTNQQLTASAADQKTAINAIITAATGAADFAAFKTAMGAITPVTRSLSMATPEEIVKDEIEEPVVEKKTTTRKKSTAKADTQEEV